LSERGFLVRARSRKGPSGSLRMARANPPPRAPVAPTTAIVRSPLGSLIEEILCEIDRSHMTGFPHAFRCGQRGPTHAAADVEDPNPGNEGQTLHRAPTEAIPERERWVIIVIGGSIIGSFQLDLWGSLDWP
jgi:hypothetical protein